MLEITYGENGLVLSDFDIENYIHNELVAASESPNVYQITVSCSLLVDGIRLAVSRGEIHYDNVLFIFHGKKIRMNRFARLDDWPNGFADIQIRFSEEILYKSMQMHKSEKGE